MPLSDKLSLSIWSWTEIKHSQESRIRRNERRKYFQYWAENYWCKRRRKRIYNNHSGFEWTFCSTGHHRSRRAWEWGALMGMKMYNKFQSSFAATKAKKTFFNSLIFLQNPHFRCAPINSFIRPKHNSLSRTASQSLSVEQRKEQHNRFWSPSRINFTFRGNFRDLRVDGIIFSYMLMLFDWWWIIEEYQKRLGNENGGILII